jgi:membrane associated rhomboid family serine protease
MGQEVCCYRHPDRETGIRCARCDRPICPECMISASVGFQCPECVRDHTVRTRQRTVAGGIVARDPFLITKILIALNIAVFALEWWRGDRLVSDLGLFAACDPAGTPGGHCYGVADGEWYRVVTSAFVHERSIPPTHILFNMLSLWWIGAPLERVLGRARYVAVYAVSALAGSAAVLLISPGTLTIGASGAIFGLFGATAVFMRRLNYDMRPIQHRLHLHLGERQLAGPSRRAARRHRGGHSNGVRTARAARPGAVGDGRRSAGALPGAQRGGCGAGHVLRA